MKVTFVFPQIIVWESPRYYSGIASLSAVLKRAGHDVSLLHYTKPVIEQKLAAAISKESPDIIGFSCNTHMFRYVKKWAPWIKKHFDIPIICGGVHPSIEPQDVINTQGVDMICIGEGEEAMVELCSKYENGEDITSILSLWIKQGDTVIRNPVRPLIENLDTLPFEDRELFDYEKLYASLNYTADVIASRGCPYNCSYCCNSAMRKVYPNKEKYVRFRSVDKVIEEIRRIIIRYPFTKFIRFFDDILLLNKAWFKEFAEKYKNEIGLPFSCQCRADLIDKEAVELLKGAGCFMARFGVESGNDFMRNEVLNRHLTKEQMINAFNLCREKRIQTRADIMLGAPFENLYSIQDTVKLSARIHSNIIFHTIFYPYPGTKLYEICRDMGFLTEKRFDSLLEGSVISQDTITSEQVSFAFESFPYLVKTYSFCNRLPQFLRDSGIKVLDSLFCSKIIPYRPIASILAFKKRVFYKLAALVKKHTPRIYSALKRGQGTRL